MPLQSSMGSAKLDVRYGDRFTLPYYNGTLISTATPATARAGRVVSITSNGFVAVGLVNGASATTAAGVMPLYALSGLDANNYPDVQRDRGMPGYGDKAMGPGDGSAVLGNGFYGIPVNAAGTVTGPIAAIRHNAAAELATTEFDTALSYAVGAPLTCVREGAANAGRIRTVTAGTDHIIGYVAPAAAFWGPEGYRMLAFTPAFVLGSTAPAA